MAVPLLILFIAICVAQVRREQAEARVASLQVARATAARLRTLHADSAILLAGIAAHQPLGGRDCREALVVLTRLPRYAGAFLFDSSHEAVCSGDASSDSRVIGRIQSELRAGRLSTEKPLPLMLDGTPMLVLSAPVEKEARLVLLELAEVRAREALPSGAILLILGRGGRVLAQTTTAPAWTGGSVAGSRITSLGSEAIEGLSSARGVDGVVRQFGFARIPELGWTVCAGIPTDRMTEPVREMFLTGAFGGLGILLVVGFMAVMITERIGRPLRLLAAIAEKAGSGSRERIGTGAGPAEIVALSQSFNRMVDRRDEADERMRGDETQLKALSERLLTVQEDERGRIARELHDDLGQSLTALKMDVIGLLQRSPPAPELAPLRERILTTLDATVTSVQQISAELRPSVLDDLGLVAAIEGEARLLEERSGIECELRVSGDGTISPEDATALYRIVQEALTNVARHANATRTELRLEHLDDELLLEIRDDGRGMSDEDIRDPRSLGLIGIRERAGLAGGSAHFEGVASVGTIVTIRIPRRQSARHS